MTSSANLTFRAQIANADACDLSPNASADEFREEAQHHTKVVEATAEYLRRCGRDVAECSHLSPDLREAARDFHMTYRGFMAEWLELLAAAERAAEGHANEVRPYERRRPSPRQPIPVKSSGASGVAVPVRVG